MEDSKMMADFERSFEKYIDYAISCSNITDSQKRYDELLDWAEHFNETLQKINASYHKRNVHFGKQYLLDELSNIRSSAEKMNILPEDTVDEFTRKYS